MGRNRAHAFSFGPMSGGGGGLGRGLGAGGAGLDRGGGAVSSRRPAPPVRLPLPPSLSPPLPGAWSRWTVGLGRSVAPVPLREGASGQVSAGGVPSARATRRGADSRGRSRVLRGCLPPRPASLGRGPARAPPAALGPGCRGVGVRPRSWRGGRARGSGGVGGRRLAFALRPCRGLGALAAAPRRSPAPHAPVPAPPAPEAAAGAGAPGPSPPTGWGPGPSRSRRAAGLCVRPALALASFLPVVPRLLG